MGTKLELGVFQILAEIFLNLFPKTVIVMSYRFFKQKGIGSVFKNRLLHGGLHSFYYRVAAELFQLVVFVLIPAFGSGKKTAAGTKINGKNQLIVFK